jgi:uncharacterized protein (TIGR03083 family)
VHRWAETTVRTRATGPLLVEHSRGLPSEKVDDPAILGPWLAEGADELAQTLRAAGPGTPVWTPVPGGTTDFYARRFTHETAMHRADATLALDQEAHPRMRELLGPDRTLHFHATDTAPQARAEWLVDLTGDAITWRRAHEKAAVAVRGPLTDLLLVIYKRRPPGGDDLQVFGDAALLDFWLERVSFG